MESTRNLTQIHTILGRLILATVNACINCRTSVMDISFGNKKVKLNIFNATQEPSKDEDCFAINLIDLIQESVEENSLFLLTKTLFRHVLLTLISMSLSVIVTHVK